MRLRLALCDPDADYAMRIAESARYSDIGREVEIAVCTRPELVAEWRETARCDGYVVGIAWADRIGPLPAGDRSVIWIGETEGAVGPDGARAMLKYGPASALIRAWAEQIGRKGGEEAKEAAPIVGIWSPAGGAGRTTLIARLAKLRSTRGLRTFAAGIDPGTVRGDTAEHDPSDWLFRLKAGLAAAETRGGSTLLHTFAANSSYREWSRIGPEEGGGLLAAAASFIGEGMVLADAGSGWSHWADSVWRSSAAIVCLIPEDAEAIAKTDRWLLDWPEWEEEGAYRHKTVFVLNRCLSSEASAAWQSSWVKGAHRLPYVPEWKQSAERSDPMYQIAAERLLAEVMGRCGES